MTSVGKLGANVSATRNTEKMIISAMNIRLRPYVSAIPPRAVAPTRMPAREAAVTRPLSAAFRWNWIEISGRATPVMNTTMPSKNLPAQASAQIRNCIAVIGAGASSIVFRARDLEPAAGHGGAVSSVAIKLLVDGQAFFDKIRFHGRSVLLFRLAVLPA